VEGRISGFKDKTNIKERKSRRIFRQKAEDV
jgi:hypothetical protein